MNYVVICKSAEAPFEYELPPRFLFASRDQAIRHARTLAAWRKPFVLSAAYLTPMTLPEAA
jgi:hypothetical protein